MQRMVLASHVIISRYGFWLPNDQRGSWSEFVGAWELLRFGKATKTDERHSLAYRPFDSSLRRAAKAALKYPPVIFNGLQARAIARGFAQQIQHSGLTVWACSILPDHIHLVVKRHRYNVETITNHLKGSATRRLDEEGIHPLSAHRTRSGRCPKAFSRGEWKVFLDCRDDILRAIPYVERNPGKEGLAPQRWSFVTPVPG
jgi:REP element-mobilizing transposase RayT